jgi:hypothetical protein
MSVAAAMTAGIAAQPAVSLQYAIREFLSQ